MIEVKSWSGDELLDPWKVGEFMWSRGKFVELKPMSKRKDPTDGETRRSPRTDQR